MLKKAGTLLLISVSLATWISCAKTSSHYLYAAIPSANEIFVYREDPNSGILTQLALSPIAAGLGVQSLALHPSNKYLYAANSSEGDVSLFTISSDGALDEMLPRATTGVAPTVLAIDTAGAYLYVANSGTNNISVFSISATDGTLTPVAGSPVPVGISPINLKLAPGGGVLYVTGQGSLGGVIEAFSVNNGQLTQVPGSPFQTGNNPYGLAISPNGPNGSFLYTANSIDDSISEFSINTTAPNIGALTELAGSPIGEVYTNPLSLLVSTSGNYVCVANEGSSNITVYAVASNGSLSAVSSSPFSSASGPAFIASDPNGEYLFIGTQTSPRIQPFGLAGDGSMTAVASYQIAGTPTSIVVVP